MVAGKFSATMLNQEAFAPIEKRETFHFLIVISSKVRQSRRNNPIHSIDDGGIHGTC